MSIQIGQSIPASKLTLFSGGSPVQKTTAELFSGKKVVLFGVPGAFTPTCHSSHLPSFVQSAGNLREKGIQSIYCLSVNDAFVMDAWDKATGAAQAGITLLADGNAEFSKAIGLELDLNAYGMGMRCQRFAMVVDDGNVTHLEVESNAGLATCSRGDSILSKL